MIDMDMGYMTLFMTNYMNILVLTSKQSYGMVVL